MHRRTPREEPSCLESRRVRPCEEEDAKWVPIPEDTRWSPPENVLVRDNRIGSILEKYLGEEHQLTVIALHALEVEQLKLEWARITCRETGLDLESN